MIEKDDVTETKADTAERTEVGSSGKEGDGTLNIYEIGYHISPAVKEEDLEKIDLWPNVKAYALAALERLGE